MAQAFLLPIVMLGLGLSVGYFLGRKSKEEDSILQKFSRTKIDTEGWRVAFLLRDGQTRMTGEMSLKEAVLRIGQEKAGAYLAKVVGVVWKNEILTPQTILDELEKQIDL